MSSRYFEAGISAAVPLTNRIPEEYKDIFKASENCIVFKEDCSDVLDKLADAIENEKRLAQMANLLREEIIQKHTCEKQAQKLTKVIEEIL